MLFAGRMTNWLAILSLFLDEDVPAEPSLTIDEVAALPDGAEVEHHAHLAESLAR